MTDATSFLLTFFDGVPGELVVNLCAKDGEGHFSGDFQSIDDIRSDPTIVDRFIAKNELSNIYFVPALCVPGTSKPSGRCAIDDLAPVEFVFVDCDPPDDAHPGWKEQMVSKLGGVKCYSINDSGNGVHGHFRLSEPVSHETAKKLQKQLVAQLGGDVGATGLNQPARLPGTRTKDGGTATNLHIEPLCRFDVSARGGDRFLESLPLSRDGRVLMMDGKDSTGQRLDNSDARFNVLKELVLAGVDDEVLHEFLERSDLATTPKEPRGKINNERWRQKRIDKARECVSGWLTEMNAEMFVTIQKGQTVIGSFVRETGTGKETIEFSPYRSRRGFYENKRVNFGGRAINQFDAWMRHPMRAEFKRVVCDPAQPPGPRGELFNTWRGMVEPRSADIGPFEDFLAEVICSGDDELFQYAVMFFARLVQKPSERGEVAFVMRGDKGTGKGTLANAIGSMFKGHYRHIFNQAHLTGRFNDHLRDCVLLFGDEVFFAGDRKHEGILKGLITEPRLVIEQKNMPVIEVPNMLTVVLAANAQWAIPASQNERRYCVANVSDKKIQDHGYFERVRAVSPASILHWLLAQDISEFNHRNVPDSEGLRDQKNQSLDAFDRWLVDYLEEGRQPFEEYFPDFNTLPLKLLFENYRAELRHSRYVGEAPTTLKQFTLRLRAACPEKLPRRFGRRMTYEERGELKSAQPYRLPTLGQWRAFVEKEYLRRPMDWSAPPDSGINKSHVSLQDLKVSAFDLQRRYADLAGHDEVDREFVKGKLDAVMQQIAEFEQPEVPNEAHY